jgi:hypothetical protein
MDIPQNPIQSAQDGKLLHFLKELPGWCIVGVFLFGFTTLWIYSHDDFVPRIIDALMGAFLGLVVSQRPRPSGSTVNTDTVNADVKTDSVTISGKGKEEE